MRSTLACFLLACLPLTALADEEWFTVYGEPAQVERDLIQIRPVSITYLELDLLSVEVRVSRSAAREAYGGGYYRGHQSTATVDCAARNAWYTRMRFYGQPGWSGPVIMERSFKQREAPLVFKEIPEQADRLIRAACRLRR
mgnify:FL=1